MFKDFRHVKKKQPLPVSGVWRSGVFGDQVCLPGVVFMGERHRANGLTDKVYRKRHLEESFHLAGMEVQLLESEVNNRRCLFVIQTLSHRHDVRNRSLEKFLFHHRKPKLFDV